MSKVRIYTLAKELGVESQRMLAILDSLGVEYKSASSTLDEGTVQAVKEIAAEPSEAKNTPTASQGAPGVEAVPQKIFPHRAPTVTVMGHVDHGKTSLLDFIRHTKVAEKEAGGITQHVGAFEANTKRGRVVFIDTPGHEAFTSIRERGAQVADIAVIVVAADDGVMPQTREAIAHAKAANVQIVVAINKIDLPGVNVDRIKEELSREGVIAEDYGGDVPVIPISARTGQGVDDLLEYLNLVAELADLRADPDGELKGVVIEARVDRQAGVLATVIVQNGTLRVSDFLVIGETYGKVRALTDANGARITQAGPGTAVQLLGFSETPHAGDTATRARDEHVAREQVQARKQDRLDAEDARVRRLPPRPGGPPTLFELLGNPGEAPAEERDVNVILRADTQGSVEAIKGVLERAGTEDVKVNLLFAGIGAPTEGDVLLASTGAAIILCFNVTAPGSVKKMADLKGLQVKTYKIIYELVDEVQHLVRGTVAPVFEDRYAGKAEVRMVIRVPKAGGNIAGSYVQDGHIMRGAKARVLRKGKEFAKSSVSGLKRFKEDVREVQSGYECGINLANFDEFEAGDIIEVFETVEVTPGS